MYAYLCGHVPISVEAKERSSAFVHCSSFIFERGSVTESGTH